MSDLKNLSYTEHRKILELQRQIHEQEIQISLLTLQKESSQMLKSVALTGGALLLGFKIVGLIFKKSSKKEKNSQPTLHLENDSITTQKNNRRLNFLKIEARKMVQTFLKAFAKELLIGFLLKK
jgi:hypothetical protein